jgi:hypothetical protein
VNLVVSLGGPSTSSRSPLEMAAGSVECARRRPPQSPRRTQNNTTRESSATHVVGRTKFNACALVFPIPSTGVKSATCGTNIVKARRTLY